MSQISLNFFTAITAHTNTIRTHIVIRPFDLRQIGEVASYLVFFLNLCMVNLYNDFNFIKHNLCRIIITIIFLKLYLTIYLFVHEHGIKSSLLKCAF